MFRSYYAGNIMTLSRARDGFLSLQARALAFLSGMPASVRTITEKDARRAGYAVQGSPLFVLCASADNIGIKHPQYDARTIRQFEEIKGQSSRVRLAMRQAEAFDALAHHARIATLVCRDAGRARVAKRIESAVGISGLALCALLPDAEALSVAIAAHDGHAQRNADWCRAVAYINAERLPHI